MIIPHPVNDLSANGRSPGDINVEPTVRLAVASLKRDLRYQNAPCWNWFLDMRTDKKWWERIRKDKKDWKMEWKKEKNGEKWRKSIMSCMCLWCWEFECAGIHRYPQSHRLLESYRFCGSFEPWEFAFQPRCPQWCREWPCSNLPAFRALHGTANCSDSPTASANRCSRASSLCHRYKHLRSLELLPCCLQLFLF